MTPSQISRCQTFSLQVTIKDQDSNTFNHPATVSITSDCPDLVVSSFSISTGQHTFSLHNSNLGTCSLVITSSYSIPESSGSVSSTESITFLDNSLSFTLPYPSVIPKQTVLTTDSVSLQVCVYDLTGAYLSVSTCSFTLSLSLSSLNPITGVTSKATTSSCSSFTSLKFQNCESTTLVASSVSISSTASIPLTIKKIFIKITPSNLSPSTYFTTQVLIELTDELGNPYTGSASILASIQNSNHVSSSIVTTSGSQSISFYFTAAGSNQVTITVNGYTESIVVDVLSNVLKFENLKTVSFI